MNRVDVLCLSCDKSYMKSNGSPLICPYCCSGQFKELREYKSEQAMPSTNVETRTSERLRKFDTMAATITKVRGHEYQHPSVDFAKVNELKACVQNCRDPLVRHVLEMLCLKMARLIHNPSHLDSWIDIAGYARCGVMVSEPNQGEVAMGIAMQAAKERQ